MRLADLLREKTADNISDTPKNRAAMSDAKPANHDSTE
jgi:hypothetical protein